MNIKLFNAEGRPTILGWIVSIPIFPILIPCGMVINFKMNKWKNDYETFKFAKDVAQECVHTMSDQLFMMVIEMQLDHVDGYIKWEKVLNPPNKLYWGYYTAAKIWYII